MGPQGGVEGRRGGLIAGPLARELVRQLLAGLSHPAREKDHLARRADISNDTAVHLPSPFLLSFSRAPPGPFFTQGSSLFPSRCPRRARRTRSSSSSFPRGTPRARFGNCTRFAASSYPPCRGAFLRKAPLANGDFVKSLLLRCTCFPFLRLPPSLSLSLDNDGRARMPTWGLPPILLMSPRCETNRGPCERRSLTRPERLGIEIRIRRDCVPDFSGRRYMGTIHPREPFALPRILPDPG